MSNILQTIKSYKLEEIAAAKRALPQAALEREAAGLPLPRGFAAAMRTRITAGGTALVAEIKARSPSKGTIREEFDAAAHAAAYAAGGATCLSVLTDARSFGGSRAHLTAVRASVPLPTLRKDFLFDPYQAIEARAWGADAVIVILAATDDVQASEVEDAALSTGMDVLVEVHDEAELARALRMRTRLIGINNRDLATFAANLATTERLAPLVPAGYVVVSESGLACAADLHRLRHSGVHAFLVGESLMREPDLEAATRRLLAPERVPEAARVG